MGLDATWYTAWYLAAYVRLDTQRGVAYHYAAQIDHVVARLSGAAVH